MSDRSIKINLGVVVRRTPGVTKWAKHSWKAVAVLPGAASADWSEMRRDGEAVEYHAGTLPLELFRTDTEAYLNGLSAAVPSIYVIMDQMTGDKPELHCVTASPYEAQDYMDNGESLVEAVPMPDGLIAWVSEFTRAHHVDEEFVKRKRKNWREQPKEDGRGDARISQATDVYRAPRRKENLH